jgi:hypothetical protein
VRPVIGLLVGLVALASARVARTHASAQMTAARSGSGIEAPFAPSPASAPYLSLGFREVAADLLYVRMLGYFAGDNSSAKGVADLAEAITALDPRFRRAYITGANAATLAKRDVDQTSLLRVIAMLERGATVFPTEYQMPYIAGQLYTQDLKTDDPRLRREWDEKGTLLIESAIRKPGAPVHVAAWAATMRTKFGQHERAVTGLREMLLTTSPGAARERLIQMLAELEEKDAASVGAEIFAERRKFERVWKRERPAVSATMYILVGPPAQPGFEMGALATGGRELMIDESQAAPPEPLD